MASSSEHTNITVGLSISVRDSQTWEHESNDYVSFFTDSANLLGVLVTIGDKTYKLIKNKQYNNSYRYIGVAL